MVSKLLAPVWGGPCAGRRGGRLPGRRRTRHRRLDREAPLHRKPEDPTRMARHQPVPLILGSQKSWMSLKTRKRKKNYLDTVLVSTIMW